VRNIKVLTYDDVGDAVFPDDKITRTAWWTAGYITPDHKSEGKQFDVVTPEIKSHLQAIENIIQTHRDWRMNQGALRINQPGASININPKPLPSDVMIPEPSKGTDFAALRKRVPIFIRGQAGIKLAFGDQSSRSRSLVEELMIIAGRVAGLFAREHNLPVPYRGLTTLMPASLVDECRAAQTSGIRELPASLSRQVLGTSAGWILQQSPSPQTHDLLGISADSGGYVQVTSPMRRYLDILTHWQFEAHFHGSRLPFTTEELVGTGETSLAQAARRINRRRYLTRTVSQFYAAHAVSQLLADPEGIGSTHLEFRRGKPQLTAFLVGKPILGSTYLTPRTIAIKELGIQAVMVLRPADKVPEFNTEFPVEIHEVNDIEARITCMLRQG
jgi:hypothetical protein